MTTMILMLVCLLQPASPFAPITTRPALTHATRQSTVVSESLAEGLFKQVFGGFMKDEQTPKKPQLSTTDVAAGRAAASASRDVVADIDARAKTGDVTFDDFLKVGRTFRAMGGKVPGGELTALQIEETLEKFEKHEKIVKAMTKEERANPQLVLDDLENIQEKCPRIQRLSRDSSVPERDVALFCAEFEAMRISTRRIAEGEDPDKVNEEIGSANRAQRRAAKKAQKKRRR